jgi:hypothetical protein
MKYQSIPFLVFAIHIFFMSIPSPRCEYYEYTNKDGVKTYTDDKGAIPDKQIPKIKVHKESYDGLTDEEKAERMKTEEQEITEIRSRQEAYDKKREEEKKKIEAEEAELAQKKQREKLSVPVHIANNSILVPVTIGYSDKTLSTVLVLDTGATITTIANTVAGELNEVEGKISASRVANGSIVKTKLVDIKYIKVGSKMLNSAMISIIPIKGHAPGFHGLLGQDFLSKFPYTIDYKKSQLIWNE